MKLGLVLGLGGGLFCIVGSFVVALPTDSAPQSKTAAQAKSPSSSSITLSGEVNVLAGACAASGITIKDNKLPTVIEKVRMGSAAAYAGLAQGDRVLNGQIGQNKMFLAIERAGKKY
ncbi:MAG: hypothetical protein C0508_30200, partial [Cyanobacteria bacterium PR.023]|nr:hypothetical protein [Cyanobacteria bacterium PR.023]